MKNVMKLKSVCMYVCIAVISFSCSKDDAKASTETSFYKPSGVITQEKAMELSAAWSTKNSNLFSKSNNTKFSDEVQSLWWSLEDLRNYLEFAENEAQEKGYNMTGVRVYFAAYPEKDNQSTLFFAPTGHEAVSKASSLNINFFVKESDIPVPPLNEGGNGNGGYPQ